MPEKIINQVQLKLRSLVSEHEESIEEARQAVQKVRAMQALVDDDTGRIIVEALNKQLKGEQSWISFLLDINEDLTASADLLEQAKEVS